MSKIIDSADEARALARVQSQQRQYAAAAQTLMAGIDLLEAELTERAGRGAGVEPQAVDSEEALVAQQLADLFGMLGGAYRKQDDLVQASYAYDEGFHYESNPRYGIVNSYNALNRLVTRILMFPDSLSDSDALRRATEVEFVDVPHALDELQTELLRQVSGPRANDYWAAGDLAFTGALNGDRAILLRALEHFAACSPPAAAYQAYAYWIGAVAQLATVRKEALNAAQTFFETGMKSSIDAMTN